MKLLFTGGHMTPALSVIEHAIKKQDQIFYVGRKFSSQSEKISSREQVEMARIGVSYATIDAIKLNRHSMLTSLLRTPVFFTSLLQARKIIKTFKPDVIVSFGGYLAVPIVLVAKISNIPIFTHEQTSVVGLANKIIENFADVVAYAWRVGMPGNKKYVHTGNPLRKEFSLPTTKPDWYATNRPILYITGGSQGSKIINQTLKQILPRLLEEFAVIHQCGGNKQNHYIDEFSQLRKNFTEEMQSNYQVQTWFTADEVAWVLEHAHIAVTRAGANTITEMMHKATPGIFIPLPFSGGNEQYHNAQMITSQGGGEIILQQNLTAGHLLESILKMTKNQTVYKEKMHKLSNNLSKDPVDKIYQSIQALYDKKT